MYKDNGEHQLLGRRRDADAHERPGALVGGYANFAAPFHGLSKIPRLFDVSGTSRAPRGEIFKSASVQFFAYFFFKQTVEIEQNNGRLIRQLNPKCVENCKGRHWNEIDRDRRHQSLIYNGI